jgi:DMSO reductase family type II enzyme heme b subunit
MPGWHQFTDEEVKALVRYIKAFAPDEFQSEDKPQPIQIGTPPQASPELIERGELVYQEAKCFECHGIKGRGNGKKARDPEFKDDWGYRIFPRNLTHPWEYRGEAAVEDIYKTITTGLDGTPMASFEDSLSDEERWALAHYLRSLQTQRKLGFTLVAKLVEKLPSDPEDPLWDSVDYLDIPMVGQIIVEPRMFTPRVDNVRVQAVYNDKDVAFRLVWDDSTETKPDPVSEIFKDAIAVQFPVTVPTGSKRPYFLMGDDENPVYLWSSERSDAIELNAKGENQIQVQSESGQQVTAKLKYDDGQYRLVFKRGLSTPDKDLDIQFAPGQFIPMSFFAWDGANKETGVRNSLSSWYYLLLEPTTSATIYLYPFVVFLVMGGAEWWVIGRIRKNNGRGA